MSRNAIFRMLKTTFIAEFSLCKMKSQPQAVTLLQFYDYSCNNRVLWSSGYGRRLKVVGLYPSAVYWLDIFPH